MNKEFFEGKDFGKKEFKALMPQYYPSKYKKYIQEETKLLKYKLKGADRILEAGVGIGRLIPELAPLVDEFVGIDNADLMLLESKKVSKNYSNMKIFRGNLEEVSNLFSGNYFDFSLCVWNTLGNVTDEVEVLKQISKVTNKSIFITVYLKGTVEDRINWYDTVGIKILKIDRKKEIFYSQSGLKSKSYSIKDIEKIATKAKLKIKDVMILADVILWVELEKI